MPRRFASIDGRPDAARLCHALAAAYRDGAQEAGHEVRLVEAATLTFPALRSQREFGRGANRLDPMRALGWKAA